MTTSGKNDNNEEQEDTKSIKNFGLDQKQNQCIKRIQYFQGLKIKLVDFKFENELYTDNVLLYETKLIKTNCEY